MSTRRQWQYFVLTCDSLTTYYEVSSAYLPKDVQSRINSEDCTKREREALIEENLGFLFTVPFYRVVLDEAHAIKDPKTQSKSTEGFEMNLLSPSSFYRVS